MLNCQEFDGGPNRSLLNEPYLGSGGRHSYSVQASYPGQGNSFQRVQNQFHPYSKNPAYDVQQYPDMYTTNFANSWNGVPSVNGGFGYPSALSTTGGWSGQYGYPMDVSIGYPMSSGLNGLSPISLYSLNQAGLNSPFGFHSNQFNGFPSTIFSGSPNTNLYGALNTGFPITGFNGVSTNSINGFPTSPFTGFQSSNFIG